MCLTQGYFSLTDLKKDLQILTPADINNAYVVVHRLVKEGELARHPSLHGKYRLIETTSETIDWVNASEDEYHVHLPLGLSKIVQVLPKSIIVLAGVPNAGKSALCLETIRLNQDKLKINYFSSEMGPTKLKSRLRRFENVEFPTGWKFNALYRSEGWADALTPFPDDLNIIDYVELSNDVYIVGDILKGIFNSLKGGIAIVCLQKKYGADMGRGAEFSLEKPSLYLSVEKGKAKIIKAKEWRGETNPNGKQMTFKLHKGWEFEPDERLD